MFVYAVLIFPLGNCRICADFLKKIYVTIKDVEVKNRPGFFAKMIARENTALPSMS